MNRRVIALMSLGHCTVDIYAGLLPILLFLLRPTLQLSYAMVGVASLLFTLTSSIVQPVFGYLSDRHHMAELLPIGCLLCAGGMCLAELGPPYPILLLLLAVAGCGSALYHPEAAKTTAYFGGPRRGSAMSLFSVGGNAGFALGPGLLLALTAHAGGSTPLLLFCGGLVVTALLWRACRPLRAGVRQRAGARAGEAGADIPWRALGIVLGVIMLRSWLHTGLVYFLPYWVAHRGDRLGAGAFVSAFLLAGIAGTLVGGILGDRLGRKPVVLLSLLPLTPLLLLFLHLSGPAALAVIALCGMLIISSFSVTVVIGQELLVRHLGMASGLTTGFAIGMGGLGVLAIGALADHLGLERALLALTVLPPAAAILATRLPGRTPPLPATAGR